MTRATKFWDRYGCKEYLRNSRKRKMEIDWDRANEIWEEDGK